MAASFERQLKDVQALNAAIRSLGESSRTWGSAISSAFEKVSESQKEAVDYTRELELAQKKIEEYVGVQEKRQKSITEILQKQGEYYKNGLNILKSWEQRLKSLEKQTDSMLKKASYHFLALGTKVLQKVGNTINNIFSLKGAIKLLKIGIGTAIGVFAGLVSTVKSVGGLIYRHLSQSFRLVSNIVRTSSGYVISFFRKIWDTITSGGGEIRQAIAEMAQAFGFFNKTAWQAANFLRSNIRDWYQMGLSVGEATKYVIEYNKAYGRIIGFGNEAKRFFVENIKMSRALGIEAEQSAKLSRTLEMSNKTLKDLAFSLVGTFGPNGPLESMGVMIPEVARDIADSTDQLALLNDQGKKTFIAGAVWVRQYGFAIKDLTGIMDKFDTLSSAAENVSKLNQMFGVSINAMEMLVDTDPAARLEKVQQKLLQAGKSWESMDYFQRKSLASMMGLNAEQAQLVFSGKQLGKSRKEIAKAMEEEDKRQRESQKRQAEVMSAILNQLRASRGIMGSILPIFYRLWVAFGRVFRTFLWGARKGALNFVEGWAAGIRKLAADPVWKKMSRDWSIRWQETMKSFGIEWGKMWSQINMKQFGKDFYGTIDAAIDAIKKIIKDLFPNWAKSAKQGAITINDIIHGIAERLQGIIRWLGENGADIIRGIGKTASGAFSIIKKVFSFFDKSNWGAAANVMKELFDIMVKDMSSILGYTDKMAGKMLTGFDPALIAAKGLKATYMFMRNIVIEINQWWKKNGDEVKNFFKKSFETAKPWLKIAIQIGETTGKIVKAIGEFLAKHPAIVGIIASFKAASFITKGLFGLSLGQIGTGIFGRTRGGVQPVYVTNSSEISKGIVSSAFRGPGVTGWSNTGAITGVLGGAMLGGELGGFSGGILGGGVGAIIGGFLGPIGSAIASGIAGIFSSILSATKTIMEETKRIQERSAIEELNTINKISEEWTAFTIRQKTTTEYLIEAEQRRINKIKQTNEWMEQENNRLIRRRQIELENHEIQRDILKAQIREERDPEKKRLLREKLNAENKEIRRIEAFNVALSNSSAMLIAENKLRIAKNQAELLEQQALAAKHELERIEQEEANKKIIERAKEKKEEFFKGAPVGGEGKILGSWIQNLVSQTRGLGDLGVLEKEDAESIIDQITKSQETIANLTGDAQQEAINNLYNSINNQINSLIEAGKFPEAKKSQELMQKAQENALKAQRISDEFRGKTIASELALSVKLSEVLKSGTPPEKMPEAIANAINSISFPSAPSIPYAFGGLVKQATNAIIGEAGPELIIPMRRSPVTNSPGTEAIITDYLNRMESNKKKEERTIVIPINIDGRKLGSGLVRISSRSI